MEALNNYTLMYGSIGVLALGAIWLIYEFARVPIVKPPELGPRGAARAYAREKDGLFRMLETPMQRVASWVRYLPLQRQREEIAKKLLRGGEYLGVDPDEFIALKIVYCLLFGGIGSVAFGMIGFPAWVGIGFAVVGWMHPDSQCRNITRQRHHRITRRLPEVIDLMTLCMSAGLDFPGSLERVLATMPDKRAPEIDELSRVMQELSLGITRERALMGFADRVPIRPVQDFVYAIAQAEQKGTPLADVLGIQAKIFRLSRTVAAEESVARATMYLMIPLVFDFGCLMLLMLSPVALKLTGAWSG